MKKKTISKTKFDRVAAHPKAKWKSAYITDDFTKYVRSFYWRDSGGIFLYAHVCELDKSDDKDWKNEYWCRVDMRTMF